MVALVLALSIAPRQAVPTAKLSIGQPVSTALLGKAPNLVLPLSSVPKLYAGKTPESKPNVNPVQEPLKQDDPKVEAKLDALFDGKFADVKGEELLARLSGRNITLAQVGTAISGSKDLLGANESLEDLGLLKPTEQVDQWALTRLWHEAAPTQPAPKIDNSWPVPSLTVDKDGITWHVHGVFHGSLIPGMATSVKALGAKLEDLDLPLYTEELLGDFYGLSWGGEVKDRQGGGLTSQRLFNRSPSRLAAAVGAAAMALWSLWYLGLGVAARLTGKSDLAHWLRARRAALFSPFDLAALRRTELPMPLNASLDAWVSMRSEIIANTAKADAIMSGKKQAHVLVGHKHVHEVLWHLLGGPRA